MNKDTIYRDYNATTPLLPEVVEPPSTIVVMGVPPSDALGTVRLTLGRRTGVEDVERAAALLGDAWLTLGGA